MKKVLTKEDVLKYLESLPEATWAKVRDAVAPATVKKLMLDDLRATGHECTGRTSYQDFLCGALTWCSSPVGHAPWVLLKGSIPFDLGIDISDPSPVLDITFVPGMVVRMKTLEELRATSGVSGTEHLERVGCPRASFVVASMGKMCGNAYPIGQVDTDGIAQALLPDDYWWVYPWMVKEVIYDPANPKPYILDPDDPRVSGLMGKKVYYSDYIDMVTGTDRVPQCLAGISRTVNSPFGIGATPEYAVAYFRYIRPVEEPKVEEMTVEQICKALGKMVKIVKKE